MKLYEIIKGINENKFRKGNLFVGQNLPMDLILEYDGSNLIYNSIMGDTKTRDTVTLCSGEMDTDYKFMDIEEKDIQIYCFEEVKIKNGIGIFKKDYIDSIHVCHNDKIYEIVPIDNKIAIPKVENEIVKVIYKKFAKASVLTIDSEDFK